MQGGAGESARALFPAARPDRVAILQGDPGLALLVEERARPTAVRRSTTRVLTRDSGTWDAGADAGHGHDGLGLLVIDGMVFRGVGIAGRRGGELLAAGDLLQPAQLEGENATLPFEASWRVLSPLQLAILDRDWMVRMAPFPEVAAELVRRVMLRSRRLASLMAIAHHHRLDDRLWLFFWEMADRWGRVTPDGVRLTLPLTHELIADLVGAQRPSTSTALGRLGRAGRVVRHEDHWLLRGDPPAPSDVLDESAGSGAVA
jgi:CRP/FNR family transcriptional regulator, cyclic AMP receptor protein